MKKPISVAFTGPESSGKTTLAQYVSATYTGFYVEEFARVFLQHKNSYQQSDLDLIAEGQYKSWQVKHDFLVADTEMTVLCIWSLYKYQSVSARILELFKLQRFDVLFLCKPDIPWEFDPMRENPFNRDELFDLYHSFLIENKQTFVLVEGNEQQRKSIVDGVITSLLKN
ncbi:MAG: ATP-binding protein [Flavobacteriales bacterium]|nr:ATP-binding protein [Flavobacteriales bacterium]